MISLSRDIEGAELSKGEGLDLVRVSYLDSGNEMSERDRVVSEISRDRNCYALVTKVV
jgi:hypothetical protein